MMARKGPPRQTRAERIAKLEHELGFHDQQYDPECRRCQHGALWAWFDRPLADRPVYMRAPNP